MQYRYSTYWDSYSLRTTASTCSSMPAKNDLAMTVQLNPPGKAENAVRCLNTVCEHTPVEWCDIQLSATEIGECCVGTDMVHLGAWLGLINAGRPVFLISA